jgi:hypothetical protein
MLYLRFGFVTVTVAVALVAASCGDDDSGSGASAGKVSCDIQQAGLHFCEEFSGAAGGDTGCPKNMAGFKPGTGCSRSGVTGSCKVNAYEAFFYDSGLVPGAVASVCPGGTYKAGSAGTAGQGAGQAGSTGSGMKTGTCADLAKCCPMLPNDQTKNPCMQIAGMGNETSCGIAYDGYTTDRLCMP